MLSTLARRIWSPSLVYLIFTYTVWSIKDTIHTVPTYALLALSSYYLFTQLAYAFNAERRLDALGKRAPCLRDFAPFGVGTLVRALYYLSRWKNHEFWWKMFRMGTGRERPYTVEAIAAGQRIVFTSDEENIKAILATQFQDFGKGPQFRKEWKDFLGLSIFTTDGEQWHNARQLLRPQFVKDRVSDLQTFESHVQVLLPILAGDSESSTVRIDELFHRFTIDVATDFLFGSHENSLQNNATEFAEAFTEVSRVQGTIARAGPMHGLVPRGTFFKALKVINKFVGQYIDRALQLPEEELQKRTKSSEGYTFLHALASYTRDRDVLRDQIVAVLLAGRDTTAVTMSWLFYELSKHPSVVQRLRKEILGTVGSNKEPTYEDLKSMRYLTHTLNILQRRPEIYPPTSSNFPDYLEFAPERWEHWTPTPWTYIPFNGGPRICIGQQFAMTEMAYVVTRILQTYERVECKQDEFPGLRSDIVLMPARGVRVAFSRA